MTKLISLKVTVPTDDDVTTDDLQTRMREMLEGHPPAIDDSGRRIHWAAVDVRRLVEVVSGSRNSTSRPPSRKKASGQPELPT